ncbi:hypothetical protein V5F77_12990 [Xanthobacter sp. DSM 24535]|uniref:hypothetical protein n=1 Tax=Roseixanthobacter psychrophilus TaxID=3119917 RepID=UPI003728B15F
MASRLVILLLACLWSGAAGAAQKSVSFADGACSGTVWFDPARTDEKRLRDTLSLIYDYTLSAAPSPRLPAKPADMARVTSAPYAAKCARIAAGAAALNPLDLEGAQAFHAKVKDAIADFCAFNIAKLEAFSAPAALRGYTPAPAACARYVDALEGQGDLVAVWRESVAAACAGNANPKACAARELRHASVPDSAAWMRLYLITHAWNNCAVPALKVNDPAGEAARTELMASVAQAFPKQKLDCEGAD